MRRITYFLTLTAAVIISNGCSKKPAVKRQSANTIIINGQEYPIVVIGHQTWTAVNYNGPGGVNYGNGPNVPVYGKLYNVAEAKAVSLPAGWRLPSTTDYSVLTAAIGDSFLPVGHTDPSDTIPLKLMSRTNWLQGPASNSSGFNAEPAGCLYFDPVNLTFQGKGKLAVFVTSTVIFNQYDPPQNFYINYTNSLSTPYLTMGYAGFTLDPTERGSVRFVKDN